MSADQYPAFWQMYATHVDIKDQERSRFSAPSQPEHMSWTEEGVIASAPPMDDFDRLTWFLAGRIQHEWPQDELDQLNIWCQQITGFSMSAWLSSNWNIPNLIQTLQDRESGLLRMYNAGNQLPRAEMMTLHARLFAECGCRIMDFNDNMSFNYFVENHVQSQVA